MPKLIAMRSIGEIREQMVKCHVSNVKAQKDELLVSESFFVVKDAIFMPGSVKFFLISFTEFQ